MAERRIPDELIELTRMAERHIPANLMEIILKNLDLKNEIHVNQFRAVCQSWRSFIPPCKPAPPRSPSCRWLWPVYPYTYHETKETVLYHAVPPPPANGANGRKRGWLIRLQKDPYPNKNSEPNLIPVILPPSSRRHLTPFPPEGVSFLDFGVSELAKSYILLEFDKSKDFRKLVVSLNLDTVIVLKGGTLYHGQFYIDYSLRSIHAVNRVKNKDTHFVDAIFYQGKFYAVSRYGRTVVLQSSLRDWLEIASPETSSGGGNKKKNKMTTRMKMNFLVESYGELLWVHRDGCASVGRGGWIDHMLNTEVKFKVYKLDQIRKPWIALEASDLNDRILFVGEDSCFSVSTRNFPGCPGSCIYFYYEYVTWGCDRNCSEIGVFNLDDGRGQRLKDYPPSANILMPPPT